METYLEKIGKRVHKASELIIGDIVGYSYVTEGYQYEEIRLHCLNMVNLQPMYVKWIGPECPYVLFSPSHIGFTAKDGEIGTRIHIYTPSPGQVLSKYKWSEMPIEEAVEKGWDNDDWKEIFNIKDECFSLYKITDEEYVKLGSLLPEIEVPSWSFLCQTIKGHKPIFDFVEKTKNHFKQAKEIYKTIKEEECRGNL